MSESTLTPAPTPAMTREECIRWNEREADREAAEAEVCREEQCTSDAEDAEERAASYSATAALLRSAAEALAAKDAEITAKDARIAELEGALRFYADEWFYGVPTGDLGKDRGHRARQALNPESRS